MKKEKIIEEGKSTNKKNLNYFLFKILEYLKLMRIKHYIKNLLVFLPLIFSISFYNLDMDLKVIIGFIVFSLTCSVVYIINDIQDVEKDRVHPKKCKRPIAAGTVSKREAIILLFILLVIIVGINIVGKLNLTSIGILILYLLLNILYSKKLKKVPLVDVIILVACFVLRVVYGAVIINVIVSHWLYLTIISFSFYLSLGKRRNEMTKIEENKEKTRDVLKYYTKDFLDKNMYMCLALTIVFYSLWCVDAITLEKFNIEYLIWTIPLLIVICMKYSLNIEGDSFGDPVDVVLSDKILIVLVLLYCLSMGLIILL